MSAIPEFGMEVQGFERGWGFSPIRASSIYIYCINLCADNRDLGLGGLDLWVFWGVPGPNPGKTQGNCRESLIPGALSDSGVHSGGHGTQYERPMSKSASKMRGSGLRSQALGLQLEVQGLENH